MNIVIKVTHPSGTVMEVNIPMLDSAVISMPSAPETPETAQAASETAFPAADAGDDGLHDYKILPGDLLPGKKRYASVQDMLDGKEIVREQAAEKIEEGEVGGEEGGCKGEEGGKEGKRKGKPDLELLELEREAELNALQDSRDLCEIEFRTKQGPYTPDPSFVHDLLKLHQDWFLRRELQKAKMWLDANPHKTRSRKGMKNYINSWLNRAAESLAFLQQKALSASVAKKREAGSLLNSATQEASW